LKLLNYKCEEKDEKERVLNSETGQHWYNVQTAIVLGIATEIAS